MLHFCHGGTDWLYCVPLFYLLLKQQSEETRLRHAFRQFQQIMGNFIHQVWKQIYNLITYQNLICKLPLCLNFLWLQIDTDKILSLFLGGSRWFLVIFSILNLFCFLFSPHLGLFSELWTLCYTSRGDTEQEVILLWPFRSVVLALFFMSCSNTQLWLWHLKIWMGHSVSITTTVRSFKCI